MERDFLGLGSKLGSSVKEEPVDVQGCEDSALVKDSGMQWPLSDKVSAFPQFLSFKATQEDMLRKIAHDPFVSTTDGLDSNHDLLSAAVQNNLSLDSKQVRSHYTTLGNPMQHFDLHSAHQSCEMKVFSVSNQPNQTISVGMSAPIFQSPTLPSAGKNVVGSALNSQSVVGAPTTAPVLSFPCSSSMIGTTNLRNESKTSGQPAQLTIFYAGSVNVYNDISPEKAQAIMALAGNGSYFTPPNTTLPPTQAKTQLLRPPSANDFIGNLPHVSSPSTALSSPIPITSDSAPLSGGVSASTNEIEAVKPVKALVLPFNQAGQAPTLVPSGICVYSLLKVFSWDMLFTWIQGDDCLTLQRQPEKS
ncbi:protein TIFY 6B-like isoform X2 [Malania oleifera]|uniref:protein TIFY 6B-like isoform X2 n=1 Tax=Malania oleifera TaxID=397392 RepID=UPI0025ADAB9B|nr:protein TIFY 6B-like isoform X2 [Malania oleifera]